MRLFTWHWIFVTSFVPLLLIILYIHKHRRHIQYTRNHLYTYITCTHLHYCTCIYINKLKSNTNTFRWWCHWSSICFIVCILRSFFFIINNVFALNFLSALFIRVHKKESGPGVPVRWLTKYECRRFQGQHSFHSGYDVQTSRLVDQGLWASTLSQNSQHWSKPSMLLL